MASWSTPPIPASTWEDPSRQRARKSVSANRIARRMVLPGRPWGADPGPTPPYEVAVATRKPYVGGVFTTAGGKPSYRFGNGLEVARTAVAASTQNNLLVLTWAHSDEFKRCTISERYTTPYFALVSPAEVVASGLPPTGCDLSVGVITCSLSDGIGAASTNYFYVVRGIRKDNSPCDSNRTGEFDFALTRGN